MRGRRDGSLKEGREPGAGGRRARKEGGAHREVWIGMLRSLEGSAPEKCVVTQAV